MLSGNAEQKHRWLPKLASGEHLAAFAVTESAAGSDVARLRCRAVKDGDSYILNGTKTFISNGGVADILTVHAVTDPQGAYPYQRRGLCVGKGHARVLRGQKRGQDGHPLVRHRGTHLRGLPGAERKPPGQRLPGLSGLDEDPGFLVWASPPRLWGSPPGPWNTPWPMPRSGKASASPSSGTRGWGSSWPTWPSGPRRPDSCSIGPEPFARSSPRT